MQIHIINKFNKSIEDEVVEMVERKGIGHPDSLADLIAESFSNQYSQHCLKRFGVILNHSSDKVVLSGGKANISFGKSIILKPIKIYLFGKVTRGVGKEKIDVMKIFQKSVQDVFISIFKSKDILKNIKCILDFNDGIGLDHLKEFYDPKNINSFSQLKDLGVANDTVVCSAYAGFSKAEFLAIKLENFINSSLFKGKFPETGYDVKIMITRIKNKFDITICLPFIAKRTKSFSFYKQQLSLAKKLISQKAKKIIRNGKIIVYINTKDQGKGGYVTVFGTALDKGDFGVVGRGNKYNGIINANREMSIEAVKGKNPVHHSGKLYNIISQDIANEIYKKFRIENYINISARNGHPLQSPAYVVVKICKNSIQKDIIVKIVNKKIHNIKRCYKKIIQVDPVKDFYLLKSKKMF